MGPLPWGPIMDMPGLGIFIGDMNGTLLGDIRESRDRWKAPGLGALGRWLTMDEELEYDDGWREGKGGIPPDEDM